MKIDIKFNTNTILQLIVLAIILYYSWGEKLTVILPLFIGISYVAFTFTKKVLTSLIMAGIVSYTLLIILYKDHQREFFKNHRNKTQ